MSPLYAPPERLITAAGDSLQGSSAGVLEKLAIGSAGQRKSVISGKQSWITPASLAANKASPTATTSTTGVMAGLAGSITPTFSGNLLITICGYMYNNTVNDGVTVRIYTGTGSAPAVGDALTGTGRGTFATCQGLGVNQFFPFSLTVLVTGLAVGTAYWIDLSQAALTGGTAQIITPTIAAVEV